MITGLIRAFALFFVVPLIIILGVMKVSEYGYEELTREPDYKVGTCLRKPEAIGRGDEFYPPELIVEVLVDYYITCQGVPHDKEWAYCRLWTKNLMNDKKNYIQTECPEYKLSDFEWKKKDGQ